MAEKFNPENFGVDFHVGGFIAMKIRDYYNFNNPPYNTEFAKTAGLWRGKRYGVQNAAGPRSCTFYNLDIFTREGFTDLHVFYSNKTWTWDVLLDYAVKSTKDLNGDGIMDQWGINLFFVPWAGEAFLYSNGANYIKEVDGRIQFALGDQVAVNAIQFLSDLCNVYKVVIRGQGWVPFTSGKAAMCLGTEAWQGLSGLKNAGMTNYGFVPLPKGPDISDYSNANSNSTINAIPITQKQVKETVQVIKYTDEAEYFSAEEIIGIFAETYMVRQSDIDLFIALSADQKYTYNRGFVDLNTLVNQQIFNRVVTATITTISAIEAISGQAQRAIDSLIGQ